MPGKGIVFIDMHIRDERVLAWAKRRLAGRPAKITYDEVAEEFCCHRRTARAIMHRLEGAGHFRVYKRAKRGGYVYELAS